MTRKLFLGLLLACGAAVLGLAACSMAKTQISAPEDLRLTDEEILTWSPCSGAVSYAVSVNGTEYQTKENSIDLFDIMIEPGEKYHIKVSAFADLELGSDSDWSEELVYEVPSLFYNTSITGKTAYRLLEDGTGYEIKGSSAFSGKLCVPAEYHGLPVTRIADSGFFDCSKITGVYLPDTVTEIGKKAFSGCTSLVRVRFSETLTKVDLAAFRYCESLRCADLSHTDLQFLNSAFLSCTALKCVLNSGLLL